ncbi:Hypothetical predicted protein [Marmota monax]|uniref:F-box domain-containing protein n=1 Tax=Marmota monax TaxID=9995 RepID=A0A5E4CFW6_MARMO|nr:hypothetical protein GHT09_013394 [Marmota monax]VTJ80794.1 Hypothetical predicted protein [Marmota monax]
MEFLLPRADDASGAETPSPPGLRIVPPPHPTPCLGLWSMDVGVMGVVDECVFGKDGAKKGPDGPPPADVPTTSPGPDDAEGTADTSLCCLYRHVSHDFLEIRFKIQRLLEPPQYMLLLLLLLLLLPEHVLVKIFSFLPPRWLLKCTCHHFKGIISRHSASGPQTHWSRNPLYLDDPCKQCRKRY